MNGQILLDDSSFIVVKIKLESRRLVRPLGHRDPVLVVVLGADVVPALHDGDGGDDTRGGCSYNYVFPS